ncbi:MAG: NADPH-dependent F420 reductase [Chloroflexi bacterium]|nr:NADPH-dependent F420 reductase [Chloroflexota bacterium]
MTDRLILTLAILGGTGNEGPGLAYRWAQAGYHVIIGSRSSEKAAGVAADLNARLERDFVDAMLNADAAKACDIAILTVPYAAQRATLEPLKDLLSGKLLVNVTVPLDTENVAGVRMPPAGSAAQEAQEILGDAVSVTAAFQAISHIHLRQDGPIASDVLVCGDSDAAKEQTLQLVAAAGLTGWDAGPLQNSVVAEGLVAVLIGINKRYKIKSAGIRITGEQAPT